MVAARSGGRGARTDWRPGKRRRGPRALSRVAREDTYALVREAAMRALAKVDREGSLAVLREGSEKDAEPRLRSLAKELISHDSSR